MVKLRVQEILEERGLSKYWLYKRMDMSYQNFNRMITNCTGSIHYDTLDRLSKVLECPVGDLFTQSDEY